jgi:hypothetical protein
MIQQHMSPSLSACVVTERRDRLDAFFHAHLKAFSCNNIELLVFCPQEMASHVSGRLKGYPRSVVLTGQVKSGPSRKRNQLLECATGDIVVFLDDDSTFDAPHVALPLLLSRFDTSCDWLLWTTRYRHADGRTTEVLPSLISCACAGSGIEWNQAFRRSKLVEAGGWHPDFCTGERWRSGGALKLMIKLRAMGCPQLMEPRVVIEHPAQLDDGDPASRQKIRRYRYAIGAVVVSEAKNLGLAGVLGWIIRLGCLAPLRGLWDLGHGRWTSGLVRLSSPFDALRGAIDWVRSQEGVLARNG